MAHFGVRYNRYNLIFFNGQGRGKKGTSEESTEPAWKFDNLEEDPTELHNAIEEPPLRKNNCRDDIRHGQRVQEVWGFGRRLSGGVGFLRRIV